MKPEPFDELSALDGIVSSRTTFYAALYPSLRQAARELGWALALHGSLSKDLDLLAVPWTEDAASEDALVRAIVEAASGFISRSDKDTREKPHGRRAYTIHLGSSGGYVDLSVMPQRCCVEWPEGLPVKGLIGPGGEVE